MIANAINPGRLALFALLAALLAAGVAHAQTRDLSTQGKLLDRIAAVVNDGVVLTSEVDEQVAQVTQRLEAQGLQLPPQSVLRHQVLEKLIVQQIELQEAGHDGIKVPDAAVNRALEQVAKRNKISFSELPDALANQGIDYADYREQVRRDLTMQLLRQRDVLDHISVTPREIDRYLARQAKQPSADREYNVSHILIAVPQAATPAQVDKARKLAQQVDHMARNGEDFGRLAVTYSDSETALQGGELGWRKGTELPTFLANVIIGMKPGEVSAPVRAPTGFHIVKLNKIRDTDAKQTLVNQVHVRHILLKTNALEDDATVKQRLEQMRTRILKGSESFAVLAKAQSQDPGSASNGGDLGWVNPASFVPAFAKVVKGLKIHQISQPFHTRFGWHIVQLLGRREYNDAKELKREQAAEAIRASKADEDTELWLRRLRDQAYVNERL